MNWRDFIETNSGIRIVKPKRPELIKIKQLGIAKIVIVKTRSNGGLV